VEGGDVYDEEKRGDGGSLRDSDRDGGEGARGALESQATSAVPEERAGPLDQVGADPSSAEEREEGESYEGLPGLSRTIPSAFLREGG